MDLIEDIGPILGIVAFLGFAILALLIVLQAREVRRLREWAGRAPERALEADEAALAASNEPDEQAESKRPGGPSRIAALRKRAGDKVGPHWDNLDRRSPVDPRIVLLGLVAGVVAAGVLTNGFGLAGGDAVPVAATNGASDKPKKIEVAVLNATQQVGVPPVPGVADLVADDVVKSAEFSPGVRADALVGEGDTVIMFEPEAEADAEALAELVADDLGRTDIKEMTDAVRDQVENAPLALLVGFDDGAFGQDAAASGVAVP